MKQQSLSWSCAVLAFTLTGCVPGDTGGGGGLGSFTRGFAFVRDRDIYVADDSNVSSPLQLTTTADNRNPSLSKDGRRVVFVRGSAELWVVNATSDPRPTLVPLSVASITGVHTPVFSPDGNTIVFAYDASGVSSLGRINVDGTNFRPLTSQFYYAGPSFFPNGSAVLAARGSSPASYTQLVGIDINSGLESVFAGSLGAQACAIANRVAVSPSGTRVAFDARTFSSGGCSGGVRIFVRDGSTGAVTRLTNYPAEPLAQDGFPTWVGSDQVGYASDAIAGINNVYSLQASLTDQSGPLRVPTASEPYYGPN